MSKTLTPHLKPCDKPMFYKYLGKSKFYFEFGSGGSTYVASTFDNIKKIISVESDKIWCNKVLNCVKNKNRVKMHHINIEAKPNSLGYPGPNSKKETWFKYSDVIKRLDKNISSKIDLILIDGRFRVACCLKCYNAMSDRCVIAFDDFIPRKHYHIILNYFNIIEKSKSNTMVILKKKPGKIIPQELIKKYELIPN